MENSIEEDIILLKDFTEGNFKRDKLENYKGSYKMGYFYYKDIQQALEHILSDYKRALKENEKYKRIAEINLKDAEEFKNNMCEHRCLLKSENEILQKENKELKESNEILNDAYWNECITKQTIKDKIEKINDESHAEELEDIMNRKNYTITELVQYVLQELLEGRK